MAENNPNQGSQGIQYVDVDTAAKMAELAALRAIESQKAAQAPAQSDKGGDDEDLVGFSPKLVKQLQTTVSVFNALKEFGSSPLQKAIEGKVGDMAAGVIEQAFSRPSGPPPKKDLIDTFLNSQMAYGLGQGLGQRAPELVETLGKTFGQQKAEEMIDGVIGKYGSTQGGRRQVSSGPGTPQAPAPEQKVDKTSEQELLLSLDPNNPEHVAAYAETQGGISVDVARKMLMIHQDDFIKQMQMKGVDTQEIGKLRGSRATGEQKAPIQQDTFVQQQAPPVHSPQPPQTNVSTQPPQTNVSTQPPQTNASTQPSMEYFDDRTVQEQKQEYAEYRDMVQPEKDQDTAPAPEPVPVQDGQQTQMMKMFADDIGKIMGEMMNKIESMNNTIFTLQNDINTIKKGGISTPSPVLPTVPIITPSQPPEIPPSRVSPQVLYRTMVEQPARRTLEIKRSEDFFEDQIQDTSDFLRELEKEAKTDIKKEETKAPIQQPTMLPLVQPVPPPIVQPIQPIQPAQSILSPMVQPEQSTSSSTQANESSLIEQERMAKQEKITEKEKIDEQLKLSEEEKISKEEKIEEKMDEKKEEKMDEKKEEKMDEKKEENIEKKKEENIEKKKEKKFVTPIKKDGINKRLIPSVKKTGDSSLKEDEDKAK